MAEETEGMEQAETPKVQPPDKKPAKRSLPEIPETQSESPEPQSVFATGFYRAAGIPFCSSCGEKRRTNESGVFCPSNKPDCPML
ncbi:MULTISPECIES: hypothetical protein [Cyanophyceae]|uniref:hypothetical protein n=1 Tax=Cyanophyceae TaxID=3028117 RepID=UPI0016868F9E|nr:hypothetical protein [Trichocoleus sp. FACHB-40]MBD2005622.1 hypothetical protein [Trichocoleus sp. FACHB-40]